MARQTASRAARRSSRVSSARKCSSSGPSRCNESLLVSSRLGLEAKEREPAGVFLSGGVYGILEVDGYDGAQLVISGGSTKTERSRRTKDQSLESSRATWRAGREAEDKQQQHVVACCCS
jgi:hypothetical protein